MKHCLIFLIIYSLLVQFIFGRSDNTDSLKNIAYGNEADSIRYDAFNKLFKLSFYANPDSAMVYGNKLLEIAIKLNASKQQCDILTNLGLLFFEAGKHEEAALKHQEAFKLAVKINDTLSQGRSLGNLGNTYLNRGDYKTALEYFMQALEKFEAIKNQKGISIVYGAVGNLYFFMNENEKAELYYNKALEMNKKLGNVFGEAISYMNLGLIYKNLNQFEKAVSFLNKSIEMFKKLQAPKYEAQALANLGNVYTKMGKSNMAVPYILEANRIFHQIGSNEDITLSYIDLAKIYFEQKYYKRAAENGLKAYRLADSAESVFNKLSSCNLLKQIYAAMEDYKNAWKFSEEYIRYDSIIMVKDKEKKVNELMVKFETEQKEKENRLLQVEKIANEAIIEKQNYLLVFSAIGLTMLLVLVFVTYGRYRYKKKTSNELKLQNAEILQQKEEIQAQRDEIEQQKNHIALKNKTIYESISYAQTIQKAILPEEIHLKKNVADAFILYLPKDIVSGDFYWFDKKNSRFYLASVDCTGHGVPGAFMSFVAYSLLNQAFYEIHELDPATIMKFINEQFYLNYHKYEEQQSMSEGMEIIITEFIFEQQLFSYSGNGASFIHFSGNSHALYKTKRVALGTKNVSFETHTIQMKNNDRFYFFSDGFADQISGETHKKFMSAHFADLLVSVQDKPFELHKKILEETFNNFKSHAPQIDDVMVIGIQV